ncbi:DUF4129 domain-containing protein [Pontibacter diazotrophicus]|uniref:DUF4129 domain-containing protein n=1 Tax=Pontibacter diazotrophicus TaxID=1400979 RepID=A0A3D8L9V2_9BACT|nr:DUF4129 domain-containing protein [Pontibacter diazotrophicus]RDV14199.1 DUF4129 domain-containing protein [Pontibacter diazotrophicus]
MRVSFKHLFIFLFSFCLLCGFGTIAYAQAPDSVPAATAPVQVRLPDQEKLENMRASEDFQYYEEVRPANTFWERLSRRTKTWLREVLYQGQARGFWEFLIYVVIATAIVYIVVKMQHVDVGSLFGKKSANNETPYNVFEENIHELDLKALTDEAVTQRDFRKAIRLHYLQSLKTLTDRGLIHWSPSKTNRSYIAEIQQPDIRHEFEQLTGMFEYVWYGGAALGDELFNSARAEFTQFDTLLKQQA